MPYSEYERIRRDRRVRWAAPFGLGDNHEGFRIVGTERHFFELPDRAGGPFFHFERGRAFEDRFEVVLGSRVAAATGLDVGSTFFGTHGLVNVPGGEVHRDFPYTVTGVLESTGTAQDRAIFGTLASVWEIHETEDRLHSAIQGTALLGGQKEREATSVLMRLETPGLRLLMADEIRERSDGIAAVPINEILRFQRGVIGPVQRSLLAIAAAVVAVACLTVLTTLHQAGERRRRDVAILRNLGAVRLEVAALVFIEGVLLTGTGILLGLLLGHGGLALGSATVREATGLVLDPWHVTRPELLAVLAMALCGSLASLLPAITSYRRTPIADLQLTD
ncbi:MAG: FtsX-like permease family protein [Planctomycetota bacterium]|nr:FtsX-like permease family protein [Planctomycetota bacterium]